MNRRALVSWSALALIGLVAACTDSSPPGGMARPDVPQSDDAPPADIPPADIPPADAPPADSPPPDDAPPADAPPADAPPADAPPDDVPAMCGAAGQPCCPGETCSGGTACCSGACVDTARSDENCGACGRACSLPNATATCAMAACSVARCEPGFGDCDMLAANGCEAAHQTDARNCGACGRACPSGQVCAAGACRASCPAGTTPCGTSCVNTQTDVANCGA